MWPDDEAKQGVSVSLLLWKEEGHILNCPDEEYCDTCGEALVDCLCSEQSSEGLCSE